ncbi:MAG: DNA gyrase inhibitor YacG [Gammaproteobacteria bacterium]
MKKITTKQTKTEDICCPHCGKKNTWTTDNPTRPFCSPRCKLIDLGAWAAEDHRIPGESVDLNSVLPTHEDDEK